MKKSPGLIEAATMEGIDDFIANELENDNENVQKEMTAIDT